MSSLPEPIRLKPEEVLRLYLEIQSRIGVMLTANSLTPQIKASLKHVSSQMLQVKRDWIGMKDEIIG
jgi:hypothetical protein